MSNKPDSSKHSDSPGILGQMSRLKANSTASAAEMREFVKQLRGRTPQEVIGLLAQSNLLRATLQATAGIAVLMLLFTLLPAIVGGGKPAPVAKPAPSNTVAPAPSTTPEAKVAAKDAAKAEKDGKPKDAKVGKDALEKLGVNETKTADPKKNPLDNSVDDLFKGIK